MIDEHINEKQESVDAKDTNRLEAFSDGVFAVAITLLVLDIEPHLHLNDTFTDANLWGAINTSWPTLAAYVISFSTIGIMWLNHHRLFKHIERTNTGLLLLNLLLLMIIVFIPVPTSLVAEQMKHVDQKAGAILYAGTFLAMAVCFNVLWRYASYKGRLLARDANMREVQAISQQFLFGPTLYVVGFILAWIFAPVSLVFSFVLALFFALPGRPPRPETSGKPAGLPTKLIDNDEGNR